MNGFEQADRVECLSALPGEEADTESVLLLGPLAEEPTTQACVEHLCVPGHDEAALVLVSLTESPDKLLNRFREHFDQLPVRTSVICSAESLNRPAADIHGVNITTIAQPSDLARLGVSISDVLSELADYQTVLCFHSLSALVQRVDLSRVFRFIYTLDGRITANNTRAHYHLDPSALENQTVATLRPLFDSLIDVANEASRPTENEDGSLTEPNAVRERDPWEQLFDEEQ